MKLYFVVQSCVGFQGSLRSTHRSLVCLHKANIELNVSWLSQLDPFRLLSLGAKRPPPPSPEISPESMSRLFSLSPLSLLISRHIFSRLPCTQKKPLAVFTCLLWEQLFSMLRAHTQGQTFFSKAFFFASLPSLPSLPGTLWGSVICSQMCQWGISTTFNTSEDPYTEDWYENWDSDQLTLFSRDPE